MIYYIKNKILVRKFMIYGGSVLNIIKKLIEVVLLLFLFIVVIIIVVSIGFGYVIYLDFIVLVFFCIICLKCDLKYIILFGIILFLIIFLVFGNLGIVIWVS